MSADCGRNSLEIREDELEAGILRVPTTRPVVGGGGLGLWGEVDRLTAVAVAIATTAGLIVALGQEARRVGRPSRPRSSRPNERPSAWRGRRGDREGCRPGPSSAPLAEPCQALRSRALAFARRMSVATGVEGSHFHRMHRDPALF